MRTFDTSVLTLLMAAAALLAAPAAHSQPAASAATDARAPVVGAGYKKEFDELAVSPKEWQRSGSSFSFDGHSVFFVDKGTGPAIVALHGYPTSSWDFRNLLPALSANNRVVAPDLLGFGYSAKPADYGYTIAKQADMVTALVGHLKLAKVKLLSADIGNSVVQELLARAQSGALPFTIESVVLVNGSLFADQFKPRFIQQLLLSPLGGIINRSASEGALTQNLNDLVGPEKKISGTELAVYWYLLNYPADSRLSHKIMPTGAERDVNDKRWGDALCQSTVPLRLVVGAADPSAGAHMAEVLTLRCGKGRAFTTTVVEKAGHFPHIEYPDATAKAIVE